jgi:Lon protease-like protein
MQEGEEKLNIFESRTTQMQEGEEKLNIFESRTTQMQEGEEKLNRDLNIKWVQRRM